MSSQTCSNIPKNSDFRATRILELVHSDVCGPIETVSKGGARYFVTFIDHFSKWTCVFRIKNKSDVFGRFQEFLAMAERQTGCSFGIPKSKRYITKDNMRIYTATEWSRGAYESHNFEHSTGTPKAKIRSKSVLG